MDQLCDFLWSGGLGTGGRALTEVSEGVLMILESSNEELEDAEDSGNHRDGGDEGDEGNSVEPTDTAESEESACETDEGTSHWMTKRVELTLRNIRFRE